MTSSTGTGMGPGTGVSSQVRNVLFATQSSSLDVFYDVAQANLLSIVTDKNPSKVILGFPTATGANFCEFRF